MKKLINLVALAALLFVPSLAKAQTDDCSTAVSVTAQTPFTEGFETGSMPNCWTQDGTSNTWSVATGDYSTSTGAHAGTYNVKVNIASYSGTSAKLVTPLLDLSDITNAQLNFWHVQRPWGGDIDELNIYYRTSPTGEWTLLQNYSSAFDSWTEETITLPNTSATYQIAFEMTTHYGYGVGLDDIVIGAAPTCIRVENITTSDVDSNNITLSWTDTLNSGASYTINYWANNGTDTLTTTSTTNTAVITNLNASTAYTFEVIANCGGDDHSTPVSATFRTTCGQMQIPYFADFEDIAYNGAWPDCWNRILMHNTDPSVNYNDNHTPNGEYAMYMQAYYDHNMFATSAIPLTGNNIYVRFWARMINGGWLKAGVMTNPNDTSTFTPLVNVNGSDWTEYEFNTATLDPDSTYYAAWMGYGTSYWGALAMVDDIYINEIPSCLRVTDVALDSASIDELYIHWVDDVNTGATYTVNYWANGSTDTLYVTASTTSTSLTGLSANTLYNVTVTPNCSDGDAESSPVYSFRTGCGAMTLPFFVDFEDAAYNGAWYPCWDSTIHAGTDPSVNDQPGGSYNPTQHTPGGTYAMFLQANSSEHYNLVVGPEMEAIGDAINVSFWARLNSGWIKAGVITNPRDTNTFIPLVTVTETGAWNEYEFNTSTLDATANYRIAWLAYGDGYIGKFDDVSITEYTGCARPQTAYAPDSITAHTAHLVWSPVSGVSDYVVTYGTVNDATSADNISVNVTDTTYTITGLDGQTTYYAWVTSNCGGSTSDVRPFNSFQTAISCPMVTGLTVDSITTDGATISWTAGGTETEWLVAVDSNDYETVNVNTYTITGLDAMTGHTVHVRANCGGDDGMSAVSDIIFATRCADATCNITLNMVDSYGDGWNGNAINVYQAGVEVGSGTIASGAAATETIEVCSTSPVEIRFTRGNYPDEMQGTITDGGGNTVFTISNMGNNSNGAVLATINTPCPACIAPAGLTVDSAITATTATINWTVQDGQSAWFVALGTDTVSVSEASYTFSNLEARTTYTAYVATDCNGDTSVYVPVTFTTDCANGSCDIIVAADDSYGDGWNGAAIKFFQNGTEVASYAMPSSGHNDTALVNVCAGTPVTFNWQTGNFDYEASYTIFDGAGTEVYSSANGGVNHSDSIANACPTCLTPTGVMATAIDSNNITFVWNELDDVAEYLISFNGDAYTTGYNGTEVYAGLTPNTVYTFSVKAVCVPGADTSAARTITVRTACGVMTLPYTNDFEAETSGNLPSCWNGIGATGSSYSGTTYPAVSNTHAHSGNLAVRFEEINGTSIIATEPVPLNGDSIYVAFWGSVTSGWSGTVSLEAGVMTNVLADSTFIPLLTITGASDYALREFNTSSLTAYHDSTFHIAFRYVSNDTYSSADIDDINIRFNEGCMYPANLVATPGTDDVFLEWNTNGAIGTYAVEYRTTGGTWDSAATTTDSSYTVTGLNPATAYEARVGFLCGTDTLWTAVSFQTNCALLPVPYAENFDAYPNDVMPPCWGWSSSFATHWDGGVFLRGYHGGGSEYVVVPELDGAISKLKIEFDTKVGTIAENDGILIGVADASGTLLTWLDTIQDANFSRNAHVRKTVYFTNYNMPAGAARVAFAQLRNWNEWALIDNINIEVLPDCYPVDNLVGHNLDDIENTTFSWTPQGYATEWQVYVDTVTVGIDSLATLPDSLFTTVYDTFYTLPLGAVQGGGIYNFFVRSQCSPTDHSGWVKNEFGAGTIIMNQTTDTVEGCGFVVYDNGGPIAGYLANTNTELVIRTENVGSQLQIFGAKFGFGMDAATLTVYDGEGTTGNVLYTYNTVNGRDTLLNTVLATSTTGSMTITFVVNGSMCHTGYELYIRCTDGALCPRPTELQAQMTSETTATATWTGTASNYNFYYRIAGSETWVRQNVNTNSVNLTGLVADTVYDMYVVAICSATDSSTASAVRQLRTYRSTPELEVFTVVVNSADATMGTATADHTGEVQENTVVTATATANSGYHFTNWTVGGNVVSTDNPYTFTLTADITLTANFEQDSTGHEGIDDIDANAIALYPNPATTTVTISGISGQATVSIVDMNGREVHTQAIKHSSNQTITLDLTGYAQGAYFVRITGERINAIRKLIVK